MHARTTLTYKYHLQNFFIPPKINQINFNLKQNQEECYSRLFWFFTFWAHKIWTLEQFDRNLHRIYCFLFISCRFNGIVKDTMKWWKIIIKNERKKWITMMITIIIWYRRRRQTAVKKDATHERTQYNKRHFSGNDRNARTNECSRHSRNCDISLIRSTYERGREGIYVHFILNYLVSLHVVYFSRSFSLSVFFLFWTRIQKQCLTMF